MTYSSNRTPKLEITKVYFPTVTVIKVDDGVHSHYYTSTPTTEAPGEVYPSFDVIGTETKWQDVLEEARIKGARVEVEEFLLGEEKLAGRLFPKAYSDWVSLAEDIKQADPSPETVFKVNEALNDIINDTMRANAQKQWLVREAGDRGIK